MKLQVKWILFDFGGCLDSDGVHSRKLFFGQFVKLNLVSPEENALFQEAYTYSDQKVIGESLIVNSTLFDMNDKMCFFIAEKLKIDDLHKLSKAANAITEIQASYLKRNKKILEKLRLHYQLGIISNFSGNLINILDEFSLTSNFSFVLDSYHVGFSKPNPEIFKLAIEKCKTSPDEICFIGDNIERDIFPAKELGMKTILISSSQALCNADYTLASLEDLSILTQTK